MVDTVPVRSPFKSSFVPPYALQGQEFSCHLTWPTNRRIRGLTLAVSADLEIIHLYNSKERKQVDEGGGHSVEVTSFEEPGYLGFVLKSRVLSVPDSEADVNVHGDSEDSGVTSSFNETFKVNLFRPDLEVTDGEGTPRSINFTSQETGIGPVASSPILLENKGKGTSIVMVSIRSPTPVEMGDYLQQGEVRARFQRTLKEGLDKVKSDHPKHVALVDNVLSFALKDILSEEEALTGIKYLNEQLSGVERGDPDFADDLAEVFGDAALSIFTLDQRFSSWATALGSNVDRKVVLLNPWFAIKVGPNPVTVDFHLRCFDLQWHEHKQLTVGPVTLTADTESLLPVCGIFQAASAPSLPAERTTHSRRGLHGHRKSD